jgi:uncharacterized protein YdeI (YjbR/CyaY-like superfamily)
MNDESEVLKFSTREEYRHWLTINYKQKNGIWIVFKKGSNDFTSRIALEEAICFGWIDGVVKAIDTKSYKKYFSRRKNKENWSEKNIRLYESLLKDGKIIEAGKEVYKPTRNKKGLDVSPSDKMELLRRVLSEEKEVLDLYNRNSLSRQKQLAGFYCEAKTEETKKKRKNKIIEALKTNNKGMLY